jgi:hypothetical protein
MLDRVEMNVVGAAFEIGVIANGVFPKALLPKRIFAPMVARNRHACCHDASCEDPLDTPPSAGKIRVSWW